VLKIIPLERHAARFSVSTGELITIYYVRFTSWLSGASAVSEMTDCSLHGYGWNFD